MICPRCGESYTPSDQPCPACGDQTAPYGRPDRDALEERVGEAIYCAAWGGVEPITPYSELSEHSQPPYRAMARAAVTVLRASST